MADGVWTSTDHKTTKRGIAVGFGGGAALYLAAYLAWPAVAPPVDRLAYGVWLCAGPAVLLYAMFFSCLRLRDTPDAVNPLLAAESTRWKINQRVLTNTVEQLAMFVPFLLALSTKVDAAHTRLLPMHVALWMIARIVFWIGYRRAPAWRSPGMTWTNILTVITFGWLVRLSL